MTPRALLTALLPVLATLAACAPVPDAPATFRDPTSLIASKADFDPARFAGRWHEVARYPGPGCAGGRLDYTATGPALALRETCGGTERVSVLAVSGPGRLTGPEGEEWVLWTDTGYRTAILADPAGRGARIINRDAVLPDDRRRAALEVLDFNGFEIGRLVFAR